MKKYYKILALILCLLFVQAPVLSLTGPVPVAAAAKKTGLKKEKGKFYFYNSKGKKVKNTWKTIKTKSGSYRYYFGKDGAAYAGKKVNGTKLSVVKKINGKTYGFDINGHMLTGTHVIGKAKSGYIVDEKFYVFKKNGVYNEAKSKKLRSASKYNKNAATLRSLLGKPKKTKKLTGGCYGNGIETNLYYPHFMVCLFKNTNGKETVLGITAR